MLCCSKYKTKPYTVFSITREGERVIVDVEELSYERYATKSLPENKD